ncbi:hypothetical protein AAC387_Pa02g1070 [Persea americana]
MGSGKQGAASVFSPSGNGSTDISLSDLKEKHQLDQEKLTLTTQPYRTLKLFVLATLQYLKRSLLFLLRKGGWFMLLSILAVSLVTFLIAVDGPQEKHVQELISFTKFALWWVALGVISSVGLGSGLPTFVLYLGPHVAMFTIKAMQCGRVDLKASLYDTKMLKRDPSWLEKDCSEYGPPLFSSIPGSLVRVPLSSIWTQVQLEAIIWGLGTVLGEIPSYFISKAQMSGSRLNAVEKPDISTKDDSGFIAGHMKQTKRWLFSRLEHLTFFEILLLASVPNPLFDLAGFVCGQFGIPFWRFFLPTLIGKAIIKTFIQTAFVISVCNNQLLELIENELIWVLGHIPGLSSVLPSLIANLHKIQESYLKAPAPSSASTKAKNWDLSFTTIWNTMVWLMVVNFSLKVVTSTAQGYLRKQQEEEMATLTNQVALRRRSNGQ